MRSVESEKRFLCELRRMAGDTPQMTFHPSQWLKAAKELGFSETEIQEAWTRLIDHELIVVKPASQSFRLSTKGVDLADNLIAEESTPEKPKRRIGF